MDFVKQKLFNNNYLSVGDKSKPQMQVDIDPMKVVDAMYTEVADCNFVEGISVIGIRASTLPILG